MSDHNFSEHAVLTNEHKDIICECIKNLEDENA